MNFARFLSEESICLKLQTPSLEDTEDDISRKMVASHRETAISEIGEILYASGKIQNLNKLQRELINRERRSTSALGMGIAIPHVRSLQVKSFVIGFARSVEGISLESPDDERIKILIPMAAPPYDDRHYLKIYRLLSKAILETDVLEQFMEVSYPGEVIRIFNQIFR